MTVASIRGLPPTRPASATGRDVPGRVDVGHRPITLIHSVLAAADSIDRHEVLRASATVEVLGHKLRPADRRHPLAQPLCHAPRLNSAAGEVLARAWAAGAGPRPGEAFTIDVDSSIHETCRIFKEGGSRFGRTELRGYHP